MTDILQPPWRWLTNGTLVRDTGSRSVVITVGRCPVTRQPEMKERDPSGMLVTMNPYGKVAKLIEAAPRLLAALEGLKRTHFECEDCWYSCPKSKDGCSNEGDGDDCNCGADAQNAKIDAAIAEARGETP